MMRRPFLLLIAAAACLCASGTEDLSVSAIPAPLLANAHVVKRIEEQRYEVHSPREAVLYKRYVLTILDENGRRAATLQEPYSRLYRITDIEGALYDAQGRLQRRLKERDLADFSAVGDESLMSDTRVKAHRFEHSSYPYTIEYTITQRFNNTFLYPTWMPLDEEHLSVQKSSFTFICPEEYAYRFRNSGGAGDPVTSKEKGKVLRTWQVSNLEAVVRPFASPLWRELAPVVHFAPGPFEIGQYRGDAASWEGLGHFLNELNKGRDGLPPVLKQKVQSLVGGLSDPKEKVRVLYEYLQKNTRYISIQMGIGGWQTFDAEFVASKGYGDCKALSNFMYSLLKEAGIPAYYTLVRAGDAPSDRLLLEDFPSNQFNHVIVCVPFAKDSMWLECTNQSVPAGYMGSFTGNRKALLITPEGGKLVATPRYGWRDNLQVRNVAGSIDAEGNLSLQTRTTFYAEQQDQLHSLVNGLSKDKLKEYLNERIGLPSYEVNSFAYKPIPGALPALEEHLDLTVRNYASLTGKRLFLVPNVVNRSGRQLPADERRYDIRLSSEFHDIDSVSIEVPAGYTVEVLPKPVQLSTPFGTFRSEVLVRGNKVVLVRERKAFAGLFPAARWNELKEFYNGMHKADAAAVVLVKQGS
ncbi:DUF3857 and transglutaminase domain-containing protein [Flaviaesturariibacter amylovorans]|uniref:DUF3857 domain-containing protein n=1 Tax=Flaviaesturariibacter amylovorans TaxID=1084520 RepID=A0ABP8GHC5_9BACT